MLIDKYEQDGLLFNVNFKANASEAGVCAYRGELVLEEGEIGDADGRRKPPKALVYQAVILSKDDKLIMSAGTIDTLDLLPTFVEKYKGDFAPEMNALFYVVNITKPMIVEMEGIAFYLIPLQGGLTWNEMIEEFGLEKSDFKGQSAADKVVTANSEFKSYKPKYETLSYDDARGFTADIKREVHGAV